MKENNKWRDAECCNNCKNWNKLEEHEQTIYCEINQCWMFIWKICNYYIKDDELFSESD